MRAGPAAVERAGPHRDAAAVASAAPCQRTVTGTRARALTRPRALTWPRALLNHRFLPVIVGVLFLGMQLLASPSVDAANDTDRYATMSLRVLGESHASAETEARHAYCRENAAWQARRQKVNPVSFEVSYPTKDAVSQCTQTSTHGLAPTNSRYWAIFESRWGFPVLAAPFVAALGIDDGLKFASVLMTMLGGLATYLILRILGLRRTVAVLGQAFYYASPIGVWGSYGLTDSPSVTLSMGILLGAVLVLRRRYRPGITLVGCSMLVGCFVRYSSFLVICFAIIAASVLSLLVDRRSRIPMLVLLGVASAGALALATAARFFAWPGIDETLQDTFTGHFAGPDVADPWGKLLRLNVEYWTQWSQEQLRSPWLLVAVAVGSVMLLRRHGAFGLVGVAVAMTGFLSEIAHPVANQGDRLMIQVWVAAALGLPLLWRNGNDTAQPVRRPQTSPARRPSSLPRGSTSGVRTTPATGPRRRGWPDPGSRGSRTGT